MTNRELPDQLKAAVEFHGHLCPGLLIGYRAGRIALDRLRVERAEDEELVAIVENDSCSVDGIQFLTGCTFGKGNLFFRDHGKQVFTVARRPGGEGVRIALRPEARKGRDREEMTDILLDETDSALFRIKPCTIDLPQETEIHESALCSRCGEAVMKARTKDVGGEALCIPCARERTKKE